MSYAFGGFPILMIFTFFLYLQNTMWLLARSMLKHQITFFWEGLQGGGRK